MIVLWFSFPINFGAVSEKISRPIQNGIEAKPVSSGFNCNTLWKNRTSTKNVPDTIILYNNLMDAPMRKFLSLNKSTSSNGTVPDLFLLSSCHIKIARLINPKIITYADSNVLGQSQNTEHKQNRTYAWNYSADNIQIVFGFGRFEIRYFISHY